MRPRKKNRHLPPCIFLKHGSYYYVKAGKWERLGPDLGAALAQYAEKVAQPKGGMAELIDSAMPHLISKVKPSTAQQYRSAAKRLKKMLRDFTPARVKQKDVVQVKRLLASTPSMANCCLTVLRLTFNYALEEQLIDENPAHPVKPYRTTPRKRLVTPAEFDAIYAHAPARLQVVMDLWRLTGQRVMDVVKIRRSDIRPDGLYFKQEKTGKELIVGWNPELRSAIERAKNLRGNVQSITLFHGPKGTPSYSAIYTQWERAREKAGLTDIQARDMRAMSLTATRKQGFNATSLAAHSDPRTTEAYLRDREIPIVTGPSFGQLIDGTKKKA